MSTMLELGVTALIELPPAGTLVGLAKRAMPGSRAAGGALPRRPGPSPAALVVEHVASEPGGHVMTERALNASTGAPHARILSVAGYRPERVVTNAEICRRSTPRTSGSGSGPASSPAGSRRRDESVTDMAEVASVQAIERAGLSPSDIDAVLVATVTHPYQTPSAATLLAHRLGATPGRRSGHLGRLRRVLLRPGAGLGHGPRPAPRGTFWWWGSRSCPTSPTRTTAPPRSSSPTAPARSWWDRATRPAIGPTIWGSDGAQWDAIVNKSSWIEYRDSDHEEWPWLTMEGRSVFRWAVWQMSPVAQKALDAAGVSRRRAGRLHPAPGERADHRRDGQAAVHPRPCRGGPRHRGLREHLGRLDPAGDGPDARRR